MPATTSHRDHEQPAVAASSPPRTWAVWLATGGGVGFARFAPGTWGSVLGLPVAWAIWQLPWWGAVAAMLAVIALGVPICAAAARQLQLKDPGAVVWDEIAALPLVFSGVDLASRSAGALTVILLLGFLLFRLFDIAKPPPARWLERLPGGWGIMADDLAAGGYAALALWSVMRLWTHFIP